MIESSSSGEHPHRMVAMGLILERSIQERRERISVKAEVSQTDLAHQPKRCSETTNALIPKVTPTLQPLSSSDLPPSSAKTEASKDPSTSSGPAKKSQTVLHEKSPTDTKVDSLLSELVCQVCRVKHPIKRLSLQVFCPVCPGWAFVKCDTCGESRVRNVDTCAKCYRRFK